jgi:branched-subunit amino acid transport protein
MLGTYASFLLVLGLSALVGQAVFAACGRRTWSWLSPAVGLAGVVAVAWGAVRLPGEGLAALIALGVLAGVAVALLRPGVWDLAAELRAGAPVAAIALVAASLPFIV